MKLKFAAIAASSMVLTACAASGALSLFRDFKVNGETVSAAYQQGLYDEQLAVGSADGMQLRKAIKNLAIERVAVRQEAEKSGIAANPAVLRRIETAKTQILAQAISADFLKKDPVTEEQVRAAYQKARREYGSSEYHVRQIFVSNETDAKALMDKLAKKPSAFTEYARTDNDNAQLAQRSGDMGWMSASVFRDPALKAALLRTKPGTNSKAIKTQAGWHFLRVEAIRSAQAFPTYEKAKVDIANRLAQEKARQYLIEIVKGAKVE